MKTEKDLMKFAKENGYKIEIRKNSEPSIERVVLLIKKKGGE